MSTILKTVLFNSVTTVGTAQSTAADGPGYGGNRVFQLVNIATGTSAVTSLVKASNDGTNYITRGTLSVAGTGATVTNHYIAQNEPWAYWRVEITAIGSSAVVSVICTEEL